MITWWWSLKADDDEVVVRAPQIVQSCPFWGTWIYFGEHGKDGKHQPDDKKHPIYDSKYSTCQPDSQGTLLYGIYPMIKKIITYALGEHDLGSAQDWRSLSDLWRWWWWWWPTSPCSSRRSPLRTPPLLSRAECEPLAGATDVMLWYHRRQTTWHQAVGKLKSLKT